jgi:hypothetical protein
MDVTQAASSVLAAWEAPTRPNVVGYAREPMPDRRVLEQVLATAFEASLLQEENRTLTFRLALQSHQDFPEADGPPDGLHRLLFIAPRPFTPHELRRLTPAVDYDRSLIGISVNETDELQMWGIIQSGPGWVERFRGGRGRNSNLPDCLLVAVRGPGHMIIARGPRPLCTFEAGALLTDRLNVFNSEWLPASFASVRKQLLQLHTEAQIDSKVPWSTIDHEFPGKVAQQMLQRLISTVQRSRHGGTLLFVPTDFTHECEGPNPLVRLKYRFAQDEPRARLRTLIVRIMNTLASAISPLNANLVGWDDYVHSASRELTDLDDSIFEMSHFVATLTEVDGAVIVTRDFDLLGFGGEIAGALPEVESVAHATDLEGLTFRVERTEDVGTRHRSVYRLCNVLHEVLGIVISQDGGARFIRRQGTHVMYWDHSTIIPQ